LGTRGAVASAPDFRDVIIEFIGLLTMLPLPGGCVDRGLRTSFAVCCSLAHCGEDRRGRLSLLFLGLFRLVVWRFRWGEVVIEDGGHDSFGVGHGSGCLAVVVVGPADPMHSVLHLYMASFPMPRGLGRGDKAGLLVMGAAVRDVHVVFVDFYVILAPCSQGRLPLLWAGVPSQQKSLAHAWINLEAVEGELVLEGFGRVDGGAHVPARRR